MFSVLHQYNPYVLSITIFQFQNIFTQSDSILSRALRRGYTAHVGTKLFPQELIKNKKHFKLAQDNN